MQLKIIFDNYSTHDKLKTGLGFSCLIDKHILFDTGPDPKLLIANLKLLDININELEAVVISHNHWDHIDGLWELLQLNKQLPVYACPSFTPDFKDKMAEFKGELLFSKPFQEISPAIFTTGEIPGYYKDEPMPEQALVIRSANGISVITGCAHPGIIPMLEKIKNSFPTENIYTVLGGFHLNKKTEDDILSIINSFKKLGVQKAAPTHCSGELATKLFKAEYGPNFIDILTGMELEV